MAPVEYTLLKSVSRSFYLSLRVLPSALRAPMSVGYLFCRAADTMTDASTLSIAERLQWLRKMNEGMSGFPVLSERLKAYGNEVAAASFGALGSEATLLRQFDHCVSAFLNMDHTDQSLIQEIVGAVIKGMTIDLKTFGDSAETLKALKSEEDLNQYIGYIGGEPGRFWTKVCLKHLPSLKDSDGSLIACGYEFGTGLQMVNILRDLNADLKKGRCYIPLSRLSGHGLLPEDLLLPEKNTAFLPLYHELINETVHRLHHGYAYLKKLPTLSFRLKAAVWWPLALGLMTLEKLRESYAVLGNEKIRKVKRMDVYWLMATSVLTLPSPRLLEATYEDLREGALS